MENNSSKVLVALVPVIHTLYLDLFNKYPEHIYILGETVLEDWEDYHKMVRDLRRVDPYLISDFIRKSGLVKNVTVLEKGNLEKLKGVEIVMPHEDVSEWVAKNYFKDHDVIFEEIFLRWNRLASTQKKEVKPDAKISEREIFNLNTNLSQSGGSAAQESVSQKWSEQIIKKEQEIGSFRIISDRKADKKMMQEAESLSQKSANWWRQIGVVAVKDGKIVAKGFNRHVPTQQNIANFGDLRGCFEAGEQHELSNSIHGEASLIAHCAKEGLSLNNANLYVTVYPCPTCAKLIAEAGIKKVFYQSGYSLSDAEDILKAAEVEIILVK